MEWKRVDFNPLNFAVFGGNPVIHAWKCVQCGNEIGRTDTTAGENVPPPKGVTLPYQSKAIKAGLLWGLECSVSVDHEGLRFMCEKERKHSFMLTRSQLKTAKLDKGGLYDVVVKLPNGTKHVVGLASKDEHDRLLGAIRLLMDGE